MMEEVALSRTFGEEAGRWFHEQLESHGVEIHGGEELEAFEGDGRVERGRDQERAHGRGRHWSSSAPGCGPTRCSPSAPGSRSTTGSSATRSSRPRSPGIYAAGDCCSYDSVVHGRRLRVEHWDVAMQQGRHAAGGDARRRGAATASSRTSSATSPTGRASSTSARPTTGTRSSGAATATPASSAPGT